MFDMERSNEGTPTSGIIHEGLGGIMKGLMRGAIPALLAVAALAGSDSAFAQVAVVVGERAMPAPRVEVVPVARPGYAWVPGHWVWARGGWVWIKGHHIRGAVAPMPAPVAEVVTVRPSPRHVWVKGHHVWRNGAWVWVPGVWVL